MNERNGWRRGRKTEVILDGHMHIGDGRKTPASLAGRLKEAGIEGGVVISRPPAAFPDIAAPMPATERLDDVLGFAEGAGNLYPLFWIDPMEEGALRQVAEAVERGVRGFKVICHDYDTGDPRAMKVFRAIAERGKPILFHSGILWDGKPSSTFNRPARFEALLEIEGLKFSLAHIGWPWCDELIAVYGKFLNAYTRRPDRGVEMFVDVTPGTPPVYRRDALTKLFTVGYDVENNVIFGSDCEVHDYNVEWVRSWIARDNQIYRSIGLNGDILEKIYCENLLRLLGISSRKVTHKRLMPAED